jgi:hypothetical protein
MPSYWFLIPVYRLEIQSVMLVFSTQLREPPSTFSLVPLPNPSSPSQSKRTVYKSDSVWLGGGGVFSCVGDHILPEFNTLFLTRFRIYKIAALPQTKNLGGEGGGGNQTDKHLPQSPFPGQFLRKADIRIGVYIGVSSMERSLHFIQQSTLISRCKF